MRENSGSTRVESFVTFISAIIILCGMGWLIVNQGMPSRDEDVALVTRGKPVEGRIVRCDAVERLLYGYGARNNNQRAVVEQLKVTIEYTDDSLQTKQFQEMWPENLREICEEGAGLTLYRFDGKVASVRNPLIQDALNRAWGTKQRPFDSERYRRVPVPQSVPQGSNGRAAGSPVRYGAPLSLESKGGLNSAGSTSPLAVQQPLPRGPNDRR